MGFFSSLVGGIVGFFVGGPVGAVIGAGIGATKVGEKVVNTVLDFVTQPFMPKIPDMAAGSEADRQQGVLIQRQGSNVNIPVVYGYRKVAGAVTFVESGSASNKYLHVAYVFSEGLVEGLREVFIDDYPLPADIIPNLNAGDTVTVNSGKYKDRVQLKWLPGYFWDPTTAIGITGITAQGLMNKYFFVESPSFTNQMSYNGLAVLFVRYEWKEIKTQADSDANPFSGSTPVVHVTMLGKRVASLLTNETELYNYDNNPIRYSTNPAECLLDYLRNPRYGKGLKNSDIDWTTWKQAARKCNQTVTYVASGIQGPILTMNMSVETSNTLMTNTKLMLQNFRAYMPYVQGKYKLRIEDAGNDTDILSGSATIVQTFTKDDIVSDITFNGIEKSAKYNVVTVTYVDPDQKWEPQQVIYPETEAERQIYIDQDGGRENPGQVTLGGITNYAIAKDFARLIFNKQRRQESCVFTATSKALELEPGDCIRIQSNILNFGTDPWRVVSIKINNDMTVDIGAVRNPDDIYPYVRVGEEDIVLPTYIPKGSIIYYPSSDNRIPLGLVPPTYAVFPPNATGTNSNPPPTDPNAPGGGGVGGGPNSGPETATPVVPVPPTNVTPPVVPPPPPFAAEMKLKSSRAIAQSTGGFMYYLTFTQPSDALYSYSKFWFRENIYSPWQDLTNDSKPGSGGDIVFSIGPRPAGVYEFYCRAYSTTGEGSIYVANGTISVPLNAADQNLALTGIATANSKQVTTGWSVPAPDTPPAPRYNDDIDLLEIRPKLSGGSVNDPRRMTVTINQIEQITPSKSSNGLIKGVRIYYKYSADTYWEYEDFDFETLGNPYYPGKPLTFDLAGDFGVAGSINAQNYDFLVRLTYKDGKAAERQLGPVTAPVELYSGSNNFIAVGTGSGAALRVSSLAIPATFTIRDVYANPSATFSTGSDFVPIINSITANPSTSILTFQFQPPATAVNKFRGYYIRYREVTPGANPNYQTVPVGVATNSGGFIVKQIQDPSYSHGKTYEWVITARYSNASVDTECTNSLYAKGVTIPFGNYSTNLYDSFVFEVLDTKKALGQLVTAFAATPNIVAATWTKIQARQEILDGTQISAYAPYNSATSADVYKSGNNYYINRWYRLKFSAPSGYNQLVVYRRVYNSTGAQRTSVTTLGKYWLLGPWEKKVITMPAADANGFRTVNIRGPIDHQVFNRNYEAVAGLPLIQSYYGPTPNKFGSPTVYLNDIYPYYGAGNTDPSSTNASYVEFIFVLANSGTEQSIGLRLRDFYAPTRGTTFKNEVEGFGQSNVVNNQVVTVSDYNNFNNGYLRNINEAITGVDNADLYCGFVYPIYVNQYSVGVPNTSNNTTLNITLSSQAEDGTTIY